jgi:putative ABC transport system permease protein
VTFYRLLLHAYPRSFRHRFGQSMEQAWAARVRTASARGVLPLAAFIVRSLADVLLNAALVHSAQVRDRFFWPEPARPIHGHRRSSPMWWQSLIFDARYASRIFARNPVFTLLAVAALTLGIGANTAIFTIVHGVLLKPLPYSDPDRLVMLWSSNAMEHRDRDTVAPRDFMDFRAASAFSGLHATYGFLVPSTLTSSTGAEQIVISVVSPGTFDMLGRQPVLGRTFTDADLSTGVMVSHAFWQSRLGSDPNVVGRVLSIQHQPRTVVGVMPPDFVFPYRTMLGPSGFTRAFDVDAWLPLAFVEEDTRATGLATLSRGARFLAAIGRLKPGVTVEQARAEISGIARQLAETFPDTNRAVGATVVPVHEQTVGSVRPALLLLTAGVGFVLLMACVNLANLFLARSTGRQREMAIRSALGAGRRRLIRQTLVETMMLSIVGGIAALIFMRIGITALVALAPPEIPRINEVAPSGAVVLFTFGLSLVTGTLIGLVPAFAASRSQVQAALKESGRSSTVSRAQQRLRAGLVVAEVALAVILTIGASLLLRSFVSVLTVDPGFRPDNLLTLQITVPPRYATADHRRAFYANLFSRLEALPGVIAVGGTTRLPLGSTNVSTKIVVEGRDVAPADLPEAEFRRAVHNYFPAMGIRVLRGRPFDINDGPSSPPVVVINDTMARQMFRGEDPIGKRVQFGAPGGTWSTIVGIIGDVRHRGLESPPSPEAYIYYLQNPPVNPFIVLRTSSDPSTLIPEVRSTLHAIDKDVAAYDVRPMTQVRAESVAQRRFILTLVGTFGALALIMAAVGVFGVMELIVSERTSEIGIRLALGAQPSHVLRVIVLQGLVLAAAGIAIGLAASAVLQPLLATELYGIGAADPPTITGVPALLIVVAALACYLPARRAMRIDPVEALRAE